MKSHDNVKIEKVNYDSDLYMLPEYIGANSIP